MAWLKELHARSHILVGLGRIYAEHLHELVSTVPAAKELCRPQNIAQYERNVQRHYPEEKFGTAEGGLSDVIKDAALEALRKHKERESSVRIQACELQGKDAAPDDPAVAADEKIFSNVRPCILQEDSGAHGIDEDVQVSSALGIFSDYHIQLRGNTLHESWAPRYTSMILPWTYNYMSGGPEYAKWYSDRPAERWRRQKDAAVLSPAGGRGDARPLSSGLLLWVVAVERVQRHPDGAVSGGVQLPVPEPVTGAVSPPVPEAVARELCHGVLREVELHPSSYKFPLPIELIKQVHALR